MTYSLTSCQEEKICLFAMFAQRLPLFIKFFNFSLYSFSSCKGLVMPMKPLHKEEIYRLCTRLVLVCPCLLQAGRPADFQRSSFLFVGELLLGTSVF